MSLQAGFARVDVTPDRPTFLVGYPHVPRMSTGAHDPLLASTLYLENEGTAILLIGVDVLFIAQDTAMECRRRIGALLGLPPERILLSATHTHSGPVTADMLAWHSDPVVPPPDPAYVARLKDGIVQSARMARDRAVPAEAAIVGVPTEGVGGNRLSRDGLHDPETRLLFVRRADNQKPLALDMVYSMHPTVLHEDSTLISGDFPAFTRAEIQDRLPGIGVVYHTGPCGNLSPRYHVAAQTFSEAERLGRRLGHAVSRTLLALTPADFFSDWKPAAASGCVELEGRVFPSEAEAQIRLQTAVQTFEQLRRDGAPHGPVRTAECAVFGAEEVLTLARAQTRGEVAALQKSHSTAEVQVLRLGDAFWVGLPGECFVEYSLDIKRAAPGRAAVISLANGELQGYIVTPEADAAGGYEASCSLFKPSAGRRMADKAIELMRALP